MSIMVSGKDFYNAVNRIKNIVGKGIYKQPVKIETGKHTLRITNSNCEISTVIEVDGTENDLKIFTIYVDSVNLLSAAELSRHNNTVLIDVDEKQENLIVGEFATVALITNDAHQTIPDSLSGKKLLGEVILKSGDFVNSVNKVIKNASHSDGKYAFNCVYIDVLAQKGKGEMGAMNFVASDGNRVAIHKTNCYANTEYKEREVSALVPTELLKYVNKMIDKNDCELILSFWDTCVKVRFADCQVTTRIGEGKFPRYLEVIPMKNPDRSICVIDKRRLTTALRAAKIGIAGSENRGARIFCEDGKTLKIVTRTITGKSIITIPVANSTGYFDAYYNVAYLLEAATASSGDLISMVYNHAEKPMTINDGDERLIQIITPLQITDVNEYSITTENKINAVAENKAIETKPAKAKKQIAEKVAA